MESTNHGLLLARLTANLSSSEKDSVKKLNSLQHRLSIILQQQDIKEMLPPGDFFDRVNSQSVVSPETIKDLDAIVTQNAPLQHTSAGEANLRVFRREIPVVTNQHPASVPKWAAGLAIDHTVGPFTDSNGKMYWFDFYKIVHHVSVNRGGDVFLQVPVRGILTASGHYNLAAGSIWVRSQLLTPSAPAGTYTGLKIKSGHLQCGGAVTVSGNNILINATDICKLTVELDQPVDNPANDTSTGEDARNLSINLPLSATFTCHPGTVIADDAKDMDMEIYGTAYTFHKAAGTPHYVAILNSILLPYKADKTDCTINSVKSKLFNPDGKSTIHGSAWALPVTVASPAQLGVAAGTGAIVMELKEGISATWAGIEKGTIQLKNTYLLAEPGHISITSIKAAGNRSVQPFNLWDENNPNKPLRATLKLSYPKQFILLYHCFSNGNEAIIGFKIPMNAAVDRPLQADNKRLNINPTDTEMILLKMHAKTLVYVQSNNLLLQSLANNQNADTLPIAFALKNAFIKTTPVNDFYLFGELKNPTDIDAGALFLNFPAYFLLPSLPDPYVTNFSPTIRSANRTFKSAAGPLSGLGIVAIVVWPSPANAKLAIVFVPENLSIAPTFLPEQTNHANNLSTIPDTYTNNQSGVEYLYTRNANAEIARHEDNTNVLAIRRLFDEALRTASEQVVLLDVSTNANLFGVGIGVSKGREKVANTSFPFFVDGMDLITYVINTRIYTLPQIQWEPVSTIQNPDVSPYPFPSPVTSNDTGVPTIIGTESYDLVPIAPIDVIKKYLDSYNAPAGSKSMTSIFSLPFGMESIAKFENPDDPTLKGVQVSINAPVFKNYQGGIQIKVLATSPSEGPQYESPGFTGATIQLRNLVDLLTGNVPLDNDGNPLSVLGPAVDTIFNNEFKPSGANPRVPVERMDISGYGATIFSNWLNPQAEIAATSQTKFDVLIGRTAHEIVQVKSLLYPWGVPVVRTITIQRTSGGGVTRYDSGWKAQSSGLYDFSYLEVLPDNSQVYHDNPFEFHPGVIKGVTNVLEIKDTGHTYKGRIAAENVIMQEVIFNADVIIENVVKGGTGAGLVPSKRQRGYIQLAPYQVPLTPQQFYDLLDDEGNLGGPVDCLINVGNSGQYMLVSRAGVYGAIGVSSPVFVSQASGSLHLPKEGAWGVVKRKENTKDIVLIDDAVGIPLIREEKLNAVTGNPYRFADPADIFNASAPVSDYGLLHSTLGQKVLYARPEITRNVNSIQSALKPFFADAYALLPSLSIFPNLDHVFQLGTGGTQLQITGDGKLKLLTDASLSVPGSFTKDLLNTGNSRIYIDYSDGAGTTTGITSTFDSDNAKPWAVNMQKHTLVMDIESFKRVITITSDYKSEAGGRPQLGTPQVGFGPVLQPIVDILSFLGGFNMADAMRVTMGNKTDSWQPKFKASLLGLKLKFQPSHTEVYVFGKKVSDVGADVAIPPIKIDIEIGLGVQYNMLPFSFKSDDPAVDTAAEGHKILSIGGFIKFEGEIDILVFTISPTVGLFAFGLVELELGLDSVDGKSIEFKFAVGVQVATAWPVVGDVSVQLGIGMDFEWKDTGSGMYGLILFKGEAELLEGLIDISIHIEAKGGQETDTTTTPSTTFCVCEVEFAAEISLAFIIHFEFDVTWQEKRQIA
jgi:hypothetical protein